MVPNVPPKLFSFSAVAVGYLLIDDMTANEQNALGNWLMLVAQVLSTNAFYKALRQERGLEPSETGKNNAFTFGNESDEDDTLAMLQKMMDALSREIDDIKSRL